MATKLNLCNKAKKEGKEFNKMYNGTIVEKDGKIAMFMPDKMEKLKKQGIRAITILEVAEEGLDKGSKKREDYKKMQEEIEQKLDKIEEIDR